MNVLSMFRKRRNSGQKPRRAAATAEPAALAWMRCCWLPAAKDGAGCDVTTRCSFDTTRSSSDDTDSLHSLRIPGPATSWTGGHTLGPNCGSHTSQPGTPPRTKPAWGQPPPYPAAAAPLPKELEDIRWFSASQDQQPLALVPWQARPATSDKTVQSQPLYSDDLLSFFGQGNSAKDSCPKPPLSIFSPLGQMRYLCLLDTPSGGAPRWNEVESGLRRSTEPG